MRKISFGEEVKRLSTFLCRNEPAVYMRLSVAHHLYGIGPIYQFELNFHIVLLREQPPEFNQHPTGFPALSRKEYGIQLAEFATTMRFGNSLSDGGAATAQFVVVAEKRTTPVTISRPKRSIIVEGFASIFAKSFNYSR